MRSLIFAVKKIRNAGSIHYYMLTTACILFYLRITDEHYGLAIASNSIQIALRHEHVTLAFYLTGGNTLRFPVTAGDFSENKHKYCVESKDRICKHK